MHFSALLTISFFVVCIFSFIVDCLKIGYIQNIELLNSVIPTCFTF